MKDLIQAKNKKALKSRILRLNALFDKEKVEPAGFEPASKHMPNKLSTCVFRNRFSGSGQNRTNLQLPYLLLFHTYNTAIASTILLLV